jgi:hypothetical protein
MHRHRRVTFQPGALRATVKQVYGVRSQCRCYPKPPHNIVEEDITRASGDTRKGAIMVFVFVVDTERRPLAPCHPARARRLLTEGKAAVWRRCRCG